MAVMDEYREEREAIKTAPFSKKVEYFFDYYKWPTIAILLAALAVVGFVYEMATAKDTVLYAAFINSYTEGDEDIYIAEDFAEVLGADTKKEEVIIDMTYFLDYVEVDTDHATFLQKLVTLVAAKTLDVGSADENSYANLAYSGMFMELEAYMTADEIAAYDGDIFYIDQAVIDEVAELDYVSSNEENYPEYTYSTNPEDLEDAVAVGLVVGEGTVFKEYIQVVGEYVVIGLFTNTERMESGVLFIDYLLEEE